jgi:hypothetical protein
MLFCQPGNDLASEFINEPDQFICIRFRSPSYIFVLDDVPFLAAVVEIAGIRFLGFAQYFRKCPNRAVVLQFPGRPISFRIKEDGQSFNAAL